MGDKQKNPITIENVEYEFSDLTQEQQVLFQHCVDLDRKINNKAFALDQLKVGKDAFFGMLKEALKKPVETAQ
jgi:hypothetical protein